MIIIELVWLEHFLNIYSVIYSCVLECYLYFN